MFKAALLIGGLFLVAGSASSVSAQGYGSDLANLREDVRALVKTVGELNLRLEQLERENSDLRAKNQGASRSYATVAQLNEAVADLNKLIKSSTAANQKEILQQVSVQIEKLVKQTNANMDALARSMGATRGGGAGGGDKPAGSPVSAAVTFSDDFPTTGVEYIVAKNDTLAVIAKKTGAREKDIRNANRIADPSKLQVGQKLFVPLAEKK